MALKSDAFRVITQTNGHITPFKVIHGTNQKRTCNFLLVNNTNTHSISHRFQLVADYWSHFHFLTHSFGMCAELTTTKFDIKKPDTSLYRKV